MFCLVQSQGQTFKTSGLLAVNLKNALRIGKIMPRPGPGKVKIVVQDHKDFQWLKMQRRKLKIPVDLEGYSSYNMVPLVYRSAPENCAVCTSQKFEIKFGLKSGSSGFISQLDLLIDEGH